MPDQRTDKLTLERLLDVIPRMTVVHVSFEDFVELLRSEETGSSGPAATTLGKLVDGAPIEFVRHQGISGVKSAMSVARPEG